jgi:hypothetical protein
MTPAYGRIAQCTGMHHVVFREAGMRAWRTANQSRLAGGACLGHDAIDGKTIPAGGLGGIQGFVRTLQQALAGAAGAAQGQADTGGDLQAAGDDTERHAYRRHDFSGQRRQFPDSRQALEHHHEFIARIAGHDVGAAQFGFGALASVTVSLLHDGSARPMAWVIAAAAGFSLLGQEIYRRRVSQAKRVAGTAKI